MYRGSPSPIFDVPEFPTLRRIRPLPKRQRSEDTHANHPHLPHILAPGAAAALLQQQQHSLDLLGPNATTEDLLSHADTLSALQSYYMPILGGVQNFLAGASANHGPDGIAMNGNTTAAAAAAAALAAVAGAGRNGQLSLPLGDIDSIEFGVHLAAAAAAAAAAGVAMGGMGGYGMGLVDNMGSGTGMILNGGNMGNIGMMSGEISGGLGGHDRDEDDPRNADHYDQSRLHGHGNTKKRKVPAHAHGSSRGLGGDGRPASALSGFVDGEGHEVAGGHDAEGFEARDEEHMRDRDRDRDRERDRERDRDRDRDRERESESPSSVYPPAPFPGQLSVLARRRGKLTAVTLAGLQHKEMLKTRKRQLAAVMGALSHGDTMALDQALSTNYPLLSGMSGLVGTAGARVNGGASGGEETENATPVRKSKRRSVRLARAMKLALEMPERRTRHPDAVPFPVSEFSFSCASGTAERLVTIKEEVVALRKRLETELARQAAKAAKAAVASSGTGGKVMGKATGGRGKKERQDRDRERAEKVQQRVANATPGNTGVSSTAGPGGRGGDHIQESADPLVTHTNTGIPSNNGTGSGKTKGKKKKRSALANASNPHHLRNYVPSRLPHNGDGMSGGKGNTSANNAGGWQMPLLFLSSEIPPRRRAKKGITPLGASLVPIMQPSEEWICAFCEYDLFYGDDAAYRRAIRNRKKILRRRRRARERAAAAASGAAAAMNAAKAPPPPPPSEEYEDDYDEGDEVGVDDYGSAPPQRNARWKAGPDKESAAFG